MGRVGGAEGEKVKKKKRKRGEEVRGGQSVMMIEY